MTGPEERLMQDRANRNAARSLVDAELAQIKADLAARGIGGRIADQASSEVKQAANTALAVAKESKGIIAGTVAALGLWFFRKPIAATTKHLFERAKPGAVQQGKLEAAETSMETPSE